VRKNGCFEGFQEIELAKLRQKDRKNPSNNRKDNEFRGKKVHRNVFIS
jgi:hypothetical protein